MKSRIVLILTSSAVFALAALAVSARRPLAATAESREDQKHKTTPAKESSKPAAVPFQAGETLEYRLSWERFLGAATVRLIVVERRDLNGWDAWHFRALGSSEQPLRAIFAIDDQFDSYTDAVTLAGHRYEMYRDELGRKHQDTIELTPP